ncbi:hypothetical protein [Aeromicrobium sp.]|uniref:hypothetical protein n=1 Tax=Aeromicrobium sp. TaxID=1871063 RepID=UPI0030C56833
MRSFLSFIGGAVALLALLATVPLLWVSTHIVEEDGYVAFSSTLAEDEELQGAFAAYLADELAARGVLPEALAPVATTALTRVASRTSNQPGFVEAWEKTQRNSHRSAFAEPMPRVLGVDVGPMASFVAKRVSGALPVTLAVPDDLVVPVVTGAGDREAVQRIKETSRQSRIGAVIALVGAVACIGFARRKSVAAAGLGVGSVAVAGLLWLTSGPATQRILDHTEAPSEFARTLQKLLVDRAADSLGAWLVIVAVMGGVVAAAGLVGRAVGGRS